MRGRQFWLMAGFGFGSVAAAAWVRMALPGRLIRVHQTSGPVTSGHVTSGHPGGARSMEPVDREVRVVRPRLGRRWIGFPTGSSCGRGPERSRMLEADRVLR